MSLQDRLKKAQAGNFVGREEQLDIFRRNINDKMPDYPVILISGQGGVGKSTLLKQFQELCNDNHVPNALTDYTESTPSAAMNQLALVLEKNEYALKSFRERYQKYLELKEIIQKEPDKPDALGQIFGRLAGKSVVIAGRTTPFTSVALDLVGAEVVEEQVAAFSNWLFQKLKYKDDVQLMLDPTAELTPLFVADLSKISKQKQVVLIFDTFEDTQISLLPWLMALFDGQYGEVSDRISFVFAGRSFNQHDWLPVNPLLLNCNLEPFTEQETTLYLKNQGVIDPAEVDDIYHLSRGLPVHVAMLATSSGASDSKTTRTVVERFLRNINDSIYRQAALQVALSRQFDRDVLSHLFASKVDSQQIETLFSWMIELPFVQSRPGYWTYHPIVRAQIIAYQRNQSAIQFAEIHKQLAEYYYSRAEQNGRFAENKWQERDWWPHYVEAIYHALCANPRENLAKTKQEIADVILEVDKETIVTWVSALRQAATDLDEYEAALQLAALVEGGISAIETNKWFEAFKLFDTFGLLSSAPRNLDFEEGTNVQQTPIGWIVSGSKHQFGVDSHTMYSGNHSAYLRSSNADLNDSGRMIQFMRAEKYLGKRVRFSGYVKSKEVEEWAGLWMTVEGPAEVNRFYDDMRDRPIVRTTDWKKYEIVLDIPKESRRITFGARLSGKGQLWIDNFNFEIVSEDVSTTTLDRYEPQNLDFSKGTIGSEHFPIHWNRTGSHPKDYAVGVDQSITYHGKGVVSLSSKATFSEGFGSLGQSFAAATYIGKRLHISAYVKSQDVEGWTGLWMRVDGADNRTLSFDNMDMRHRAITGTADWQHCHIILDVPEGALWVVFGILLFGEGQVWATEFQFEEVSKDIPTTDNIYETAPINLDFEQSSSGKDPSGWYLEGDRAQDYSAGTDKEVVYHGAGSGFLKSKVGDIDGFGSLAQGISSDKYRNQRLQMSAYAKTRDVVDWAGLWMQVNGQGRGQQLSFDDMRDRPIKGTTDWQRYQIVLDVPQESKGIAFGVHLHSTGQIWVDDFTFEVVTRDVATTNDPEQIISLSTEAIKLNPNDATAYYRRALAYFETQKYEQALADCNESIRLNPQYADAFSIRGWLYFTQGKYDQSARDYEESIRLNPGNISDYYNLACAYARQKNLNDSLAALRQFLKLSKYQDKLRQISEDSDFDSIRDDPRFHALLIEFSEGS